MSEAWRDELYHWGVKGMKWKKRKKGQYDASDLYEIEKAMNFPQGSDIEAEWGAKGAKFIKPHKKSEIEKKARAMENAKKAYDQAYHDAEYGEYKNRHDRKIADRNEAWTKKRLDQTNKTMGPAVKDHKEQSEQARKNSDTMKRIGRIFVQRKYKMTPQQQTKVKKYVGKRIDRKKKR